MAEKRGPEMTKLVDRLCGDPERPLVGFHADWEPGAANLTAEERAAIINRALDDCDHPITGIACELSGAAMLFEDEAHPRFNTATMQKEPLTPKQDRAARHAELLRRAADKLRELATPDRSDDALAEERLGGIFAEPVLHQAQRLGADLAPRAGETPGEWRDRVRLTAIRAALKGDGL